MASENCTSGQPTCGSPEGTGPTIGNSSESPSAATRAVAPTTAISTPGSLGDQPQAEDDHKAAGAEGECGRVGLVQARDELAHGADEVLAFDRVAEQLGKLGDDHGQRDPGQVADPDGHRQQLGTNPNRARPPASMTAPTTSASSWPARRARRRRRRPAG